MIAERIRLQPEMVARALDAESDEPISVMCRAAGFSLNGFSALLRMRRRRNHGSQQRAADALAFFSGLNRALGRSDPAADGAAPGATSRPPLPLSALTIGPRRWRRGARAAIFRPCPTRASIPNAASAGSSGCARFRCARLVPNVITLLALCAGLTGIRLAFEERYELALGAIVFAAMLDAVDGRVARMIKGTSRFGAELDSLADFVNFGVAPGPHPLLSGA